MGYYVTQTDENFYIPASKLEEAFTLLKNLNKRDDLKEGGVSGRSVETRKWFAWMPEDYDTTLLSAEAIFTELGFEVEVNEDGLFLTGYDSKSGQEDLFLDAVKDLVSPDSFIEFVGEDNAVYRWTPTGVHYAQVVWPTLGHVQ